MLQHLGSARRCVLVHGPSQIGKSALLSELARYAAAAGRVYENRVLHISPDEALEAEDHLKSEETSCGSLEDLKVEKHVQSTVIYTCFNGLSL